MRNTDLVEEHLACSIYKRILRKQKSLISFILSFLSRLRFGEDPNMTIPSSPALTASDSVPSLQQHTFNKLLTLYNTQTERKFPPLTKAAMHIQFFRKKKETACLGCLDLPIADKGPGLLYTLATGCKCSGTHVVSTLRNKKQVHSGSAHSVAYKNRQN